MRPRRKVVVLAPLEDHISDWRMFLETRGQFRVLPALTLDAALEHLESESDCDLVVALRASRAMIQTLTYESGIRVLLVDCTEAEAMATIAHRACVSGPELPARAMDALRTLGAKKRGPKPKAARAAA